jgi:hypothetical protein
VKEKNTGMLSFEIENRRQRENLVNPSFSTKKMNQASLGLKVYTTMSRIINRIILNDSKNQRNEGLQCLRL